MPDPSPASSPEPVERTTNGAVGDGSAGVDERRSRFGPITPIRLVVLLLAVSFLAGAVGYAIAERGRDPLSATDVGFMQDMGYHHEQAVQMSLLLLAKDDVSDELKSYAQEIVRDQRYEMGLMNAILDRFGHPTEPAATAMGWMGPSLPRDEMDGLATDQQMVDLRSATSSAAESLWIALMTDHHLGGLHMADWEARHGSDDTTRNIALGMVRNQRGEVIDLDRYRTTHDLPLAPGFSNPLDDPRLSPLSLTGR